MVLCCRSYQRVSTYVHVIRSAEKEERQLHFALFIRLTSFYYYTFPSSLSILYSEERTIQGHAGS